MAGRDPAETPARRRTLYGRRQGRALKPAQQRLLADLLPRRRIAVADEDPVVDPHGWFEPPVRAVWLEIGFGSGEHLAEQAARHPEVGIVGAEPYVNGVVGLLRQVADRGLANVRIHDDDVRPVLARLAEASLERVFILFPDPWPKKRHHRRRLVQTELLDGLARVMADGAELRLATDDVDYLRWMLERLTAHAEFAWLARGPEDWSERPGDWPETRFERRGAAEGRPPRFLRFVRRARRERP